MPEFTLYGGKGGVGKTTCASATALADARHGKRTLVVSTDPAHSVGDRFEMSVGATPTSVHDTYPLYAAEIDPQQRLDDNYADTIDALTNEIENLGVDIGDTFGIDAGDVLAAMNLLSSTHSVSILAMIHGITLSSIQLQPDIHLNFSNFPISLIQHSAKHCR
jgi:arsenite efflux ATP-binding protein ArsA (TC 3.A.4.1.1)